jgi:hypothetical protein
MPAAGCHSDSPAQATRETWTGQIDGSGRSCCCRSSKQPDPAAFIGVIRVIETPAKQFGACVMYFRRCDGALGKSLLHRASDRVQHWLGEHAALRHGRFLGHLHHGPEVRGRRPENQHPHIDGQVFDRLLRTARQDGDLFSRRGCDFKSAFAHGTVEGCADEVRGTLQRLCAMGAGQIEVRHDILWFGYSVEVWRKRGLAASRPGSPERQSKEGSLAMEVLPARAEQGIAAGPFGRRDRRVCMGARCQELSPVSFAYESTIRNTAYCTRSFFEIIRCLFAFRAIA